MNSPKVTSSKYWPGLLGIFKFLKSGMYSTHGVVQAKTFVKGKSIGVQTFIVPIRDPKTMKLYTNVKAGDIGPKLGFWKVDNGFLQMHNHRIPRRNMLMRYLQINEAGEIT
jgi:acyl-CoA oxidase